MKSKWWKSKAVITLLVSIFAIPNAIADGNVDALGPNNLIAGADISIWQHPNGAAINFQKMKDSGVRFLYLKGSDSIPKYDAQAKKYLASDRSAAQAIGIHTGIYHYATLPNVSSRIEVIVDALKQSRQVYKRIKSLGGMNSLDLPAALDLESNCVATDNNGNCTISMSQDLVTLWSLNFLRNLSRLTGKTAIFYSYPTFIQNYMQRDPALTAYPLWIAQYGYSPANPTKQPGAKNVGCYVTSWTSNDCQTHWSFWQYTSCGIGIKYGLTAGRLDLSVFNGPAQRYLDILNGNWQPESITQFPFNENISGQIISINASDTNHPVIINADFKRPDGSEVVTGKVKFTNASSTSSKGVSTFSRNDQGVWQISISGLKADNYIGTIDFTDPSGISNSLQLPVSFSVVYAPKPTPQPTPPSKPSNYCANQFVN